MVTADTRPVREKPVNPGGMKIDGAENDVFSAGSDTDNVKLAAASELPDLKALHAPRFAAASFGAGKSAPVVEAPAAPATEPAPAPVPAPSKPAVAAAAAPPAPKPAPAKPLAAAASHSATPGHQLMVQLAALTSEESARTEWAQLTKKMPDLMNGRAAELLSDRAGRAHLLAGANVGVRRYGRGSRLLRSRPSQGRQLLGSRLLAACRCHGP